MNTYCRECGCVWVSLGYPSENCPDCDSPRIANSLELTQDLVFNHLISELPKETTDKLKISDWHVLVSAFEPHINHQELILNGPLSTGDSK